MSVRRRESSLAHTHDEGGGVSVYKRRRKDKSNDTKTKKKKRQRRRSVALYVRRTDGSAPPRRATRIAGHTHTRTPSVGLGWRWSLRSCLPWVVASPGSELPRQLALAGHARTRWRFASASGIVLICSYPLRPCRLHGITTTTSPTCQGQERACWTRVAFRALLALIPAAIPDSSVVPAAREQRRGKGRSSLGCRGSCLASAGDIAGRL